MNKTPNRYQQLIEKIFFDRFKQGSGQVDFLRNRFPRLKPLKKLPAEQTSGPAVFLGV